jgi:hypothetical protein
MLKPTPMAKTKIVKSPMERQWEIEDAMRTLQRAETIRKDKMLMGGIKKSMESLNKMMFGGSSKTASKPMSKPTKKK